MLEKYESLVLLFISLERKMYRKQRLRKRVFYAICVFIRNFAQDLVVIVSDFMRTI